MLQEKGVNKEWVEVGRFDRRDGRNKIKTKVRDDVGAGGGGGGARGSWFQLGKTNKRIRIREELTVPWMFPCTFHFLNAVLSVFHLTSHQCLRKKPRFIRAVHNYQPFKTGLFSTLNNAANLCTNSRQPVFLL